MSGTSDVVGREAPGGGIVARTIKNPQAPTKPALETPDAASDGPGKTSTLISERMGVQLCTAFFGLKDEALAVKFWKIRRTRERQKQHSIH